MDIKRIYNNNVALATDAEGREVVVIGRGVCFGRRAGDTIDDALVEKVFSPMGEGAMSRFEKLVGSIPSEYLVVAEDIVAMLRHESDLDIDDGILIALADHISLSVEREKRGVTLANPMLFEIAHLYRKEFALAHRAAEIIHDHLDVWVSEEEVGFITLHIVNATMSQRPDNLVFSVEMIRGILAIVGESFGDRVDPESLSYERFLRHLQFFAQRVLDEGSSQDMSATPVLLDREDYPEAFACADRIADYVEGAHDTPVTDAEKSYLVYHLANLVGSAAQGTAEN